MADDDCDDAVDGGMGVDVLDYSLETSDAFAVAADVELESGLRWTAG